MWFLSMKVTVSSLSTKTMVVVLVWYPFSGISTNTELNFAPNCWKGPAWP